MEGGYAIGVVVLTERDAHERAQRESTCQLHTCTSTEDPFPVLFSWALGVPPQGSVICHSAHDGTNLPTGHEARFEADELSFGEKYPVEVASNHELEGVGFHDQARGRDQSEVGGLVVCAEAADGSQSQTDPGVDPREADTDFAVDDLIVYLATEVEVELSLKRRMNSDGCRGSVLLFRVLRGRRRPDEGGGGSDEQIEDLPVQDG